MVRAKPPTEQSATPIAQSAPRPGQHQGCGCGRQRREPPHRSARAAIGHAATETASGAVAAAFAASAATAMLTRTHSTRYNPMQLSTLFALKNLHESRLQKSSHLLAVLPEIPVHISTRRCRRRRGTAKRGAAWSDQRMIWSLVSMRSVACRQLLLEVNLRSVIVL